MRSASMPLLGLDETRISCSTAGAGALGFSVGDLSGFAGGAAFFDARFNDNARRSIGQWCGAERLGETHAQRVGRPHRREAPAHERAQFALHDDADLAVGAVAQMNLECVLLLMAKTTVEKEVNHAFYIITEHPGILPWARGDGSRDANCVADW